MSKMLRRVRFGIEGGALLSLVGTGCSIATLVGRSASFLFASKSSGRSFGCDVFVAIDGGLTGSVGDGGVVGTGASTIALLRTQTTTGGDGVAVFFVVLGVFSAVATGSSSTGSG